MIKRDVTCNKAKICREAARCRHAQPHKKGLVVRRDGTTDLCTEEDDCNNNGTARCQ